MRKPSARFGAPPPINTKLTFRFGAPLGGTTTSTAAILPTPLLDANMTYHVASTGTDLTSQAGGAADDVSVRLVSDKGEWDRFMAQVPNPHLPQSFAYGEGKAADGWRVERAVFTRGGRTIAVATILSLHRVGLRLLNRINRGPIFLSADPHDEDIVAVYSEIRHRWGRLPRTPLLIAPALPKHAGSDSLLRRAGYRRRQQQSWCSGRIDLSVADDVLWKGVSSGFRNRVRNAEKAGAALRIADDPTTYGWMLERHVENMSTKKFSAVNPELLRALRDAAPEDVLVFQAMHGDKPVAGMSVVRFGTHAEYHVGWFGPEGRKLNAGNFLMWHIMVEMKRRGVLVFDVGGLKPGDGYTRFKQTMNPVEYALVGEWMSF